MMLIKGFNTCISYDNNYEATCLLAGELVWFEDIYH